MMGEKQGFLPFPDDFETLCIHHAKKVKKDSQTTRCSFIDPIILSNFIKYDAKGDTQVWYNFVMKLI